MLVQLESSSCTNGKYIADLSAAKKMLSEFDNELLAKLYRDSNIARCKTNVVKRDIWRKITEEYCREKNIALIDHKKLSRKWGRMVKAAKKKRSKGA